jgi:Raf kinase inhibitor-like YbhB/YbcL family protein
MATNISAIFRLFIVASLVLQIAPKALAENKQQKEDTHTNFRLRSEAFLSGGSIPRRHTGDGEDLSPSLRWENLPERTAEIALVMDDPDAPGGTWVHWILYKIPAEEPGIPENIPQHSKLEEPHEALQGKNSWGTVGYRGPLPPKGHGSHHYRFTVYALDREISVPPELDKEALLKAMAGHVIASAELVGVYER